MDPVNTIVSEKILLSDIDLQVISPTSVVYYGNNREGDEYNNVEQVLISTPTTGNYLVVLKSKLFTEVVSQPVSLIITSGGYVQSKVTSVTSSSYSSNEIVCSSGQQMVTINLFDHGGNGWGSGNSFVIQNEDQTTTYLTFTMNGDVGQDSYKETSFCLNEGVKYVAKFIQNGSNKKDMGVTIPQCAVYLSSYHTQDIIDMTTSAKCNSCPSNKFLLKAVLYGPTGGIPYGWKDDSKYSLFQQIDENTTLVTSSGTLPTGIMSSRAFCLATGIYYLEFDNVPTNDDITDGGSVGVSSYRIEITNCGTNVGSGDDMFDDDLYPYPRIAPGKGFMITVSSSLQCSLQFVDDSREPIGGNDDDSGSVSVTKLTHQQLFIGMIFGFISFLLLLR